nr:MAG TPA: hypothetical protein [Caudoviricetes sp.]
MVGGIWMIEYKAKYIGPDAAEIRTGEVYAAQDLECSEKMIGVKDRSGEWYAYPRDLFVKVSD